MTLEQKVDSVAMQKMSDAFSEAGLPDSELAGKIQIIYAQAVMLKREAQSKGITDPNEVAWP